MHTDQFRISRRRFTGLAAAAISAPMIIPRHVLGDDSNAPANEKIGLALIGIGKQQYGSHLPHFVKMPEVKTLAVCDVDTTRREAGKARVDAAYGNSDCAAYNDYNDILARSDVDAICCATPDHWHANIILDFCKAGKDIYCEKPLVNTIAEAKTVTEAVNASDIIFQTGSQQRTSDNFRKACELVRSGKIGTIKQVYVSVGGPPRPCNLPGEDMEPGLDWQRWLGPAPMRDYSSVLSPRGVHNHFPSWRNFCEYGGGGMTDWGAHHFDIALWGLGLDKSGPTEVIIPENPRLGRGVKFISPCGAEILHDGSKGIGVTFVGTDGEIGVDRGRQTSTLGDIMKIKLGDDDVHLYDSPGGSHSGHRQNWVDCVLSRKEPICTAETGSRTITLCHLGNIAYLHGEELGGGTLKWDAAKWHFIDNDAANKYLDYTYDRGKGYELPTV